MQSVAIEQQLNLRIGQLALVNTLRLIIVDMSLGFTSLKVLGADVNHVHSN